MTPEMLTAIAELVGSVAWPLLVLLLIITQRKSLSTLLSNLESLTFPGGIEAKIRRNVEKETKAILEKEPKASEKLSERQLEAAERIQSLADSADISVVRKQMDDSAKEYERLRASMPAGPERTRRMEVVATKMRTLGLAAAPLLSEFAKSDSPGRRLAAIAILQVAPHAEYLDWLAERLDAEKPFLGYHASVALEVAARVLDRVDKEKIRAAIKKAKEYLGPGMTETDRGKSLRRAEDALQDTDDREDVQNPNISN